MSNPKHRTPLPEEHKPDAYLLSPKLAKENPDLVKRFDEIAEAIKENSDTVIFKSRQMGKTSFLKKFFGIKR